MRLLIITQRVDIDDDNLGFFHRWIEKFSGKLDEVFVICLWRGKYNLPQNVRVFSIGKEKGVSKIGQLVLLQKHLLKILPKVDGIFFHMCPIYAIAGFPLAKLFRKKTILWFLHKSVGWKLKAAEKLVDKILTVSEESCRLKNKKKIEIVGHGIDTEFFKSGYGVNSAEKRFKILSVGRISPIKDQETLIKAIDVLVYQKNIKDIEVKIIGSTLEYREKKYLEKLRKLIKEKQLENYIKFLGGMPQREIVRFYQESDIFVNLCPTGGADKAVLEAMACQVPVILCNETFRKDLGPYADRLIFQEKNTADLAQKITDLKNSKESETQTGAYLRSQVLKNHNLDNLIDKIIFQFK